jgi:hypothetical protein
MQNESPGGFRELGDPRFRPLSFFLKWRLEPLPVRTGNLRAGQLGGKGLRDFSQGLKRSPLQVVYLCYEPLGRLFRGASIADVELAEPALLEGPVESREPAYDLFQRFLVSAQDLRWRRFLQAASWLRPAFTCLAAGHMGSVGSSRPPTRCGESGEGFRNKVFYTKLTALTRQSFASEIVKRFPTASA